MIHLFLDTAFGFRNTLLGRKFICHDRTQIYFAVVFYSLDC